MEQLDARIDAVQHRVVQFALHRDGAHRHRGIGEPFCHRDDVGGDAPPPRRGGTADAAECGDDLVEDQNDPVPVANLAQPLQIADRRHQHPGRSGHRLDDHRRDGFGAVEVDEALEIVGELGAMLRKAAREGVARDVVRVTQVIDTGQAAAKGAAVVDEAADADSAKAGAVIAALAPDQSGPRPLPLCALDRERDFQRRINRFGTAVGKEYPVEPVGHQCRQPPRQFKRQRMAQLKGRRKIERRCGVRDGFGDFVAAMTRVAAP